MTRDDLSRARRVFYGGGDGQLLIARAARRALVGTVRAAARRRRRRCSLSPIAGRCRRHARAHLLTGARCDRASTRTAKTAAHRHRRVV